MADGRFAEKTVDVPFTDWGRKLWEERTASLQKNDPNMQCKPSGLPRAQGVPYPMQIVQTDNQIIFLYEGYTVTIEDPKAYTHPWSTSYIYGVNPGTEIMEYWCTENEKDAKHMVGK